MSRKLGAPHFVRSLRRDRTTSIQSFIWEVGASRSMILRDLSALRDEGYVIHAE